MRTCADNAMPLVWQVRRSIISLFFVKSMVRAYHVYKDIWDAVVEEELLCRLKDNNRVDPFCCGCSERRY